MTREMMLTAREAAEYLGVHVNTLKRWAIPHYELGDRGDRRYRKSDLDAWLAQRKVWA